MIDPTSSTMVFRYLFQDVLETIQQWSGDTSTLLAAIVAPLATSFFGIYLLIFFGGLARGSINQPLEEFSSKAIRGVAIIMFATAAGIYQQWVQGTFWMIPGAIAQEIANHGSTAGFNGTGGNIAIAKMLDECLQHGLDAGFVAWDKMSGLKIMASIGYGFLAIAMWIFVGLVCAYAAALVLISNIGLAVMLGLGPLFIIFAMFESTQQFFVAWTRQVVTFALFFILLSCVLSITFGFFGPFVKAISDMSANEVVIGFVKLFILSLACVIALYQVSSWAGGLAGGVAFQTSGAIGRAVSGTTRGIVHSHYDPMKKNRDGTQGGHRLRGALPSAVNAGRYAAGRAHAYLRRNRVEKDG